MAHGKCLRGSHILVWEPPPLVRVAYCPRHDFPLALTSRQTALPTATERPKVGPVHTTRATELVDGVRL